MQDDGNQKISRVVREHLDQPQVNADQYKHSYNSKKRLSSYWHQVHEVLQFQPQNVLEIGVGNGFTADSVKREGINVITLDVAEDLRPDIVGSVRSIPLPTESTDVVVCCQVLEHLPFYEFQSALTEIYRVASKGIVISLPDQERYIRMDLTFGSTSRRVEAIKDFPRSSRFRPTTTKSGQHYWEIGCGDVGLVDVQNVIKKVTGNLARTYRVPENPYHRFFIRHKP